MFGINGGELVVLLVVAVLVVGPERLPKYAEQLGVLVRRARALMSDAKEKVSEELGPEVADVDWAQLDPRRYDPRRIVRDALLDDTVLSTRTSQVAAAAGAGAAAAGVAADAGERKDSAPGWPAPAQPLPAGGTAPFDTEAT